MIKIYLAGPVDNSTSKEQSLWRTIATKVHPEYNYFDPMIYEADYFRGKYKMDTVIQNEKSDISKCDVLLAYPWKPSSGTAMEIMYAYMLNQTRQNKSDHIKIVIVIEKDQYLSPWISHHSDTVVNDFHSAFEWIEDNVKTKEL